ncbi:MAG TPA: hypothetical protein VKF82_00065 [Candidatus Eremiobacteraceae bacterium]|nr:hypothetical protein [Candidatus Eremiobacteraceae bacterium]
MRTFSFAALLAGVALAAAATGASRVLVAAPALVVAAFGCATLVIALMPKRARACTLASACAGLAFGSALPRSLPIERVVTQAPGGRRAGDLFALLERLDQQPQAVVGRSVAVSGVWTPARADQDASVSRLVMACCAADALDVGFDVAPRGPIHIEAGTEICVSGILSARVQSGELRYRIEQATVERARSASRCTSR